MDREIPKEVRDKERKKMLIKYGVIGVAGIVCIALLISFMRSSVNRKDLVFSEVDTGIIEVSVSASGKVFRLLRKSSTLPSIPVLWKFIVREETVWMWGRRFLNWTFRVRKRNIRNCWMKSR